MKCVAKHIWRDITTSDACPSCWKWPKMVADTIIIYSSFITYIKVTCVFHSHSRPQRSVFLTYNSSLCRCASEAQVIQWYRHEKNNCYIPLMTGRDFANSHPGVNTPLPFQRATSYNRKSRNGDQLWQRIIKEWERLGQCVIDNHREIRRFRSCAAKKKQWFRTVTLNFLEKALCCTLNSSYILR